MNARRGSCFGFSVRSTFPLEYTRGDTETALPLTIVEAGDPLTPGGDLLQEWPAIPGKRLYTRLYARGRDFGVEIGRENRFVVQPAESQITVSPGLHPHPWEALLWTTPMGVSAAVRGDLVLHGSSVKVDGHAVVITAPSGRGKTTTAAALTEGGCQLLTDDLAFCQVEPRPIIWPGPAILRLRRDAASRLHLANTYLSYESDERVCLALEPAVRGDGRARRLAAVVFLDDGSGEPRLERVDPDEAVKRLWPQCFYLPFEAEVARCFRALVTLASRVPVWSISRPREWESLPGVVNQIIAITSESADRMQMEGAS